LSHKALYRQFLSAKDKGAFRAAHKKEIDEYEDAVSHLKAFSPDGTFLPMKELKVEKSRLARQRDQLKAGLRPLAEKRKQMSIITRNVTVILGTDIMPVGREHQL
ncbi:MAG: relaxase/mobilization nuclease, partial [Lachnospiraceae bacterium]|nr:relaxase/mobilization nuclease [Lachnospiraceae bacterium]